VEITEVRIKLMDDPHERLQGFCSITLDHCFVIRDLKIIRGTKGSFVAMPSRKLTDRCPRCDTKNHLRANYCNNCGVALKPDRAAKDEQGRAKLYADIAHPINSECREKIQKRVLQAYQEELIKAQQPGYRCTYDDYGEEAYATLEEEPAEDTQALVVPAKDSSHRIEPAASQPQPPHVSQPQPKTNSAPAVNPGASEKASQEDFGAGVL